jgi:hypothetical protein
MYIEALVIPKSMLVATVEMNISMQMLIFYTLVHYFMPQTNYANACFYAPNFLCKCMIGK